MFDHGGLWGIATILGPILLLAALVYGVTMYRKRGPTTKAHTDQTTRELYRRADRQEKRAENIDGSPFASPETSRPKAKVR